MLNIKYSSTVKLGKRNLCECHTRFFIVGKKRFCGSLKNLKFCKLQLLTLPTQKVADPWTIPIIDIMPDRQVTVTSYESKDNFTAMVCPRFE